jgi:transposase InsO family protein
LLDLHSKRLAGWSIADHIRTELVTDALETAARTRGGSLDGAIVHSDNGAQCASKEFANVCSRLGVTRAPQDFGGRSGQYGRPQSHTGRERHLAGVAGAERRELVPLVYTPHAGRSGPLHPRCRSRSW